MPSEESLVNQVRNLLWRRGDKALEIARQEMLQEEMWFEPLGEALRYFMEDFWEDVLHPALLSLACEAVGGDPDSTYKVGAAIVLLAGGADVHDDIIDQSAIKDTRPTVFGKFGKEIAAVVGDVLLLKGLFVLHEACDPLPKDQKRPVLNLVKQAFFRIGSAEAWETSLRCKFDFSAEEYLDVIGLKVSVSEAAMKIGAILGGGAQEQTEALAHYGKTLGLLLTMRDEFIDVFELDELKNRVERECLPLPIIAALQEDPGKKDKIISLLTRGEIRQEEVEKILDLVMSSKGARKLKKKMRRLIRDERREESQRRTFGERLIKEAFFLLDSSLEDL